MISPSASSSSAPQDIRDGMHLVNADFMDMTFPYGAGAMYSTADDLDRWFEAWSRGK
jgi:hypothetical protein